MQTKVLYRPICYVRCTPALSCLWSIEHFAVRKVDRLRNALVHLRDLWHDIITYYVTIIIASIQTADNVHVHRGMLCFTHVTFP